VKSVIRVRIEKSRIGLLSCFFCNINVSPDSAVYQQFIREFLSLQFSQQGISNCFTRGQWLLAGTPKGWDWEAKDWWIFYYKDSILLKCRAFPVGVIHHRFLQLAQHIGVPGCEGSLQGRIGQVWVHVMAQALLLLHDSHISFVNKRIERIWV
jgi:hypothetical protein